MVEIMGAARLAMIDHACACRPDEACGLLVGPAGANLIERFLAVRNVAETATAFVLDPHGMLEAEREADESGLEVKGVMHSHPTTPAVPSPTDVADTARFDPLGAWLTTIVSLETAPPVVAAFRIVGGGVVEEPIRWVD